MSAGVVAALIIVPGVLGYALLADLPPQAGLCAVVLPLLVYLVLGSSKRIILTPTANVSALVATGLGGLAAGDASRTGLLRLGPLTDFISPAVFP